ncbi:sugar ABC transporter substrate-binding protein [Lusitaniella coriacea LEGE 07157]|uniref:Sugar ABC transporter substrate-binding protein n=1 Tax=Lusitaniella coriacea LEGE 07157 TaxID=945747 RepID=A0A8J7ARI4_9CYAN|nr:sugar ABC transporter substrate-binding protein [Lusitaniella coriacea]MBE9114746.1 sugar ABC transporter substrate-binding protein [Lusitaniella coriacea LEGE 07157]
MRKGFRLLLWALVGILLSVAIACGGNSPELEFWTMQLQPKFTEYFNSAIAEFEANHSEVEVRWIDVPWDAMESKILSAVSAKNAPDVVNLNPNFASQLATRKAWLDLETKLTPNKKQDYLPKIWQASTLDGKSFGIPWYLTTTITIYNQERLTEAGIEQPPATYAELAQVAREVKAKTGKYAFFATVVPGDSAEVLESLVQMGVQLLDGEGNAGFNTPEGIAAFQYWVDLYQQELLPKEVLTQGHRRAIELYQAGETALLSSGAQFWQAIETNAPDIAKVSASAPQITGKTGKKNVAVMNLVIPRDTDKADAAVEFALFVTNTPNQLAFAKEASVLPSTQEAVAQLIEELEAKEETTAMETALKVSAEQLSSAEVLVPAMKNLDVLQKIIYENLQAAMLGKKTVEQAVSDAAQEWGEMG